MKNNIIKAIVILIFVSIFGYLIFTNQKIDSKVLSEVESEYIFVVHFLDVGQGDAVLLRTPEGDDILIDGGPNNTIVRKLGEYLPVYDRDIELMILTHPHSDHIAGLNEVLERYEVDKVMTTGVDYSSYEYSAFIDLLDQKDIEVEIINSSKDIDLGEVDLKILYPTSSLVGKKIDNVNNASIVTRFIYASTSIMLTGDFEDEEILVDSSIDLASDIFKAGHHGSNNANDKSFIETVSPKYVVISCGEDNSFGHPHYRAMKNFERVGAEVFRTDLDGDVIFYSDGQEFYQL